MHFPPPHIQGQSPSILQNSFHWPLSVSAWNVQKDHMVCYVILKSFTFGGRLFHGIEHFFTNTATKNPPVFWWCGNILRLKKKHNSYFLTDPKYIRLVSYHNDDLW